MAETQRQTAGTATAAPLPGLPCLLQRPGVRAVALVLRDGASVRIVDSAGYDCGSMDPGARLPLDAGLPVTEAVRTQRRVVQGAGPSWVALPVRRGRAGVGALLLSLTGAPPQQGDLDELEAVAQSLVTAAAGWLTVTRSVPYDGAAGGDGVLSVPDGRGGDWLIACDARGSGPGAAGVGRAVCAVLHELAAAADGPAALLGGADRELRTALARGEFATAVVVHADGRRLRVASAGHPPPVLLLPDGPRVLDVDPGLPLALEVGPVDFATSEAELAVGGVLLLHTDGLLDRRGTSSVASIDPLDLVRDVPLDDLPALADRVLVAASSHGEVADDVSLLLARPLG